MPTRRVLLENALLIEREWLWADLDEALARGGISTEVSNLIERIRAASEALGYGTDWLKIPMRALSWLDLVETVPELGIVARKVDWDDVHQSAMLRDGDLHVCDEDDREFHRWRQP